MNGLGMRLRAIGCSQQDVYLRQSETACDGGGVLEVLRKSRRQRYTHTHTHAPLSILLSILDSKGVGQLLTEWLIVVVSMLWMEARL